MMTIMRHSIMSAVLVMAGSLSFAVTTYLFSREPSADHWLAVRSVQVGDAKFGQSPAMSIDRTILREVRGNWLVTVERSEEDRGWYVFCTATGSVDYKPGNIIPSDATLDWWTWPTKCNLPVGKYQLDTTWTLHPLGYALKEITVTSNQFRIVSDQPPAAETP